MQMHHGMQQLATIMALTTRSAAYDVPFSIDKWQEFLVVIFHIYNLTIYNVPLIYHLMILQFRHR